MISLHTLLRTAMALIALIAVSAPAQQPASTFPAKPVTVVVPYATGGPIDVEARLYTIKIGELMGQPFVVDYKPGANSTIGLTYLSKASADGYTIAITGGGFMLLPAVTKNLPFDIIKDFSHVSQLSEKGIALLTSPTFPAKTFQEYIAFAKANPGKTNFGTTGAGSATHLIGAWIHSATNTQVTFIPYKGGGPMMQDLLGGRLSVTGSSFVSVLDLIKAGKVRAIAVTLSKRSKFLPDVPTISEQGIPGFEYTNWTGVLAPRATPVAIVNRLNEGFARVVKLPEVAAALDSQGGEPVTSTPAQFRQYVAAQSEHWKKIVQDNGITLDE